MESDVNPSVMASTSTCSQSQHRKASGTGHGLVRVVCLMVQLVCLMDSMLRQVSTAGTRRNAQFEATCKSVTYHNFKVRSDNVGVCISIRRPLKDSAIAHRSQYRIAVNITLLMSHNNAIQKITSGRFGSMTAIVG